MKKTTAAILIMLGLALAGFGTAGYAAHSASSAVADATTATTSPCTRAHPCINPVCAGAGYGTDDCLAATTGATTTSPCTRAHPCPNPGCTEAGFGRDDCFDTTTGETTTTGSTTGETTTTGSTSTTTTTGSTSTATTTNVTTTTTGSTGSTTTGAFLPPATTTVGTTTSSSTTTAGTTTTTSGTTTAAVSPGAGGSFRPPKAPRPRPPLKGAATELPFTGAATPSTMLIGFALLGLGLLLLVVGRDRRGMIPVSSTPRATGRPRGRATQTGGSTAARASGRAFSYRVFIPGRGAFASFADAEQSLLDRRWARAGCPRLGAPGRRRASDDA